MSGGNSRPRKDSLSRIKDSPGPLRTTLGLRSSPRNSPTASPNNSPLATTLSPFSDVELNSTPSIIESSDSRSANSSSSEVKKPKIKKKSCPCGMSSDGNEWLFVCCDCKQAWHGSCGNLKGSNNKIFQQGHITCLSKPWQCPWCFTCAFPAPSKHPSLLNSQVLKEKASQGVAIQQITDAVTESIQKSMSSIDFGPIPDLLSKVAPAIDTSSIQASLDELAKDILELKTRHVQCEHATNQPSSWPPNSQGPVPNESPSWPSNSHIPMLSNQSPPTTLPPPEPAFLNYREDFLESTELQAVKEFLDDLKSTGQFRQENGHSVVLYGKAYNYTGSKTSQNPDPIPPLLSGVVKKLEEKLNLHQPLNSVLINYFPASQSGASSFISKHSDDEPVIAAESEIVTLSIGATRTINFEEIHNPDSNKSSLEVVDNSIYSMSRKSQGWYQHSVPPPPLETDERFSLTFRSLDEKSRRSIVIIGDSNTKDIAFGEGSGFVGSSYPGKRVKAAKVNDINVNDCVGYSNIFLCCGTNNLRCEYVNGISDIHGTVNELRSKLNVIKQVCPKAKVFVSPVLPSRFPRMNHNIMLYNDCVDKMLSRYFPDVWFQGIHSFLDNEGLLSSRLTRGSDKIHLGPRGIAKLVSHIKSCVYSREISDLKRDANQSTVPSQESAPDVMSHPSGS